jgi:hypothetical protein
MRKRFVAVFPPLALLITLVVVSGCGGQKREAVEEKPEAAAEQAKIPTAYASIYQELEDKLEDIDLHITERWDGSEHDCVFAVELIMANGHRGPALLYPETLEAIKRNLDSLKSMGVAGITLSINYPILEPSYDTTGEYIGFYRKVAEEVKSRGFILLVDLGNTFKSGDFSALNVSYEGLTLEEYKRGRRRMVETVLGELRPAYLTSAHVPTTLPANTGIVFSVHTQT